MAAQQADGDNRHIEAILRRYPNRQAALLTLLHHIQAKRGHIDQEAMAQVAEKLGLTPAMVRGVASFYTMYNLKAVGKYHIQVCTNISCSLMGSEHILEYLERKLGIKVGETSEGGRYTLAEVECLASCGTAPMMQINDDYYENLTPERIDQILSNLP